MVTSLMEEMVERMVVFIMLFRGVDMVEMMVSTVLFKGVDMVDSMVYNVLFRGVGMVEEAVWEVATTVSLTFSVGQMSSSNTPDNSGYVWLTSEMRSNQGLAADRRPLLLPSVRPVLWQSKSLVNSTNTPGSFTCSPTMIVKASA